MSRDLQCPEVSRLLHAWIDDELDVRTALEVEEHLGRCRACAAEERSLRGLQTQLREQLPRYALSPVLSARLQSALRAEAGVSQAVGAQVMGANAASARFAPAQPAPVLAPQRQAAPLWRRIAYPAAPLAAALAVTVVAFAFAGRRSAEATQADAVVAAHVRSLLANHLTDVASNDQHTVKPWFQGKLDYSVGVTDWAAEGYPLVGGRLDYLEDAPAAALVYRRNQHVVNLFIWPARGSAGGSGALRHIARRGYGAYFWEQNGMAFGAVSDLNDAELEKFVGLVRK